MERHTEPIAVIVAQQVKLGRESDYEAWISNITQAASTYSGHMGTNVMRPQGKIRSEYVVIFRFDCYKNLKAWFTSDDCQDRIAKSQSLVESPPQTRQISGMETWCSIPSQTLKNPPRYKTVLLTWPVVYILISLLNRFLRPFMQIFPSWLALLMICGIMVTLSTYIVMPQVTRLFYGWLYKS